MTEPVTPRSTSHPVGGRRIVAIDVLRGLVIFVLIPDVYGGFSFYEMAKREPDSALWAALAGQMTHVDWSGVALWDMIMPVFVFLVGVSLALSVDRRRRAGESAARLGAAAALRSAALIVLGLAVLIQPTASLFEVLLPYLVLATGLPWSRWFDRWAASANRLRTLTLDLLVPAGVVGGAAGWIALHTDRLGDYDLNQILVQLGLAYWPAFLLAGRGLRAPALRAVLILVAWAAAFMLYTPPAGIEPLGEVYHGVMAHWNNGTNVAAAFDRWWLNVLPRAVPHLPHPHGYHTLQFVPLVAQMLAGVVVGRMIDAEPQQRAVALRLAVGGAAGLVLSGLLSVTLIPLVKSLWTPSWAIFSTSICLLVLAALMLATERPQRSWLGGWLVQGVAALGGNAILLYVITIRDKWRLVLGWEGLLGAAMTSSTLRPVWTSVLVLVSLWFIAWALHRARIQLRI
jgi:predicted acyltransferase